MLKKRSFPESNYSAVWYNGKTIRIAIDPARPITELEYPEFYDVKITGYCEGGCPWCYMNSSSGEPHYENVVEKIRDFFGPMTPNQRPFQVAIGGGEPTSHPDFVGVLEEFTRLGIEPNYTTNGMHLYPKVLNATADYCGGVAVSCHPHLSLYWRSAVKWLLAVNIKLNFHLIISDAESIEYFQQVYSKYKDRVDHFVLLPYTAQGRAENKTIDWEYLVQKLPRDTDKIAFGAGFYSYLLQGGHGIRVILYEPEIMSKFLDLKDMKIYPSSFALGEETTK
jgi:organic radical activating enzyme